MHERILVVDDDRQITELLERFLSKHAYHVSSAGSATQMGLLMEHSEFDLVILDVGLPDIDGFQVTRELRKTSTMPIILLTVRDEVYDKIIGLELGADDYIAKPFDARELLARMRAVLRRSVESTSVPGPSEVDVVGFSGFRLDAETRKVTASGGYEVPLTSTEFALLFAFVQRSGEALPRHELMKLIYGTSVHVTDRAIDAHVARLRRKLEASGGQRDLIKTIHGIGYSLATRLEPVGGV